MDALGPVIDPDEGADPLDLLAVLPFLVRNPQPHRDPQEDDDRGDSSSRQRGAANDHGDIGSPENEEAEYLASTAQRCPAIEQGRQQQVNGDTTKQCLYAEPATGNYGANQ